MVSKSEHELNIKTQFQLRSGTFNRSAHWITNQALIAAHVKSAGTPGKGLAMCCGTGITGKGLADAGWDMIGVDITPGMVEETNKLFPAILGNSESLPFEDNTFDLVVMRQAYFLLADGPTVLKEARRLLKPTGRIVISQILPFSDVDAPWLKKIHEVKQAQMVQFFTEQDMKNELEKYGFKVFDKSNVSVRESVSLWMENAPELSLEVRNKVCQLVLDAPEEYKKLHNVELKNDEIIEDWNFAIYAASPNKNA
ncbi:MAG: class I SAM-dependent methyltransferase [Bacteriovorax sp.]|jgi:ubiquinone/menaquinone biosynthesis C-methylase UbiE